MSFLESFARRHGGHGGDGPNVEGLSQGALGKFGGYRDIPVMCKGSIE